MKNFLNKIKDFLKFDKIKALYTTSSHKNLYIGITALVVALIVILITTLIVRAVVKKRLYKSNVKGCKNYVYLANVAVDKYSPKKHCVALIHLVGLERYDRAYDRQLSKTIVKEVALKLVENKTKKSYLIKTTENEFVLVFNKKGTDVLAYLEKIKLDLSLVKVNGEAVDITPYISYNMGGSNNLLFELNRNAIALNKGIREGEEVCGVDQELINENIEYSRLVKELDSLIDSNSLEIVYKIVADTKRSLVKYCLVGAKLGDLTSFDAEFSNAIFRANIQNKMNKYLIEKVFNRFGKKYDIKFIFNVSPSTNEDELAQFNGLLLSQGSTKESVVLAFNSEDYLSDKKAFNKLRKNIESNGFKSGLLNVGEVLDMNALQKFDFVELKKESYELMLDDSINLLNIFKTGKSVKAVEASTIEEIEVLTSFNTYPYIESSELFSLLDEPSLETFLILNLLQKPEEEKIVYVDSKESVFDSLYDETPEESVDEIFEETPVEEAPVEENEEETAELVEEDDVEEALEESKESEDSDDDAEDDDSPEDETESLQEDGFGSFRKIKSKPFCCKMDLASDETKFYYNTLKNEILKYNLFRNQLSKSADGFKYKNKACAKIRMAGKSIRLYLDLNPLAYPTTRFHQVDVSDKKKYVRTPFMVKVKSNMGLKKAIILIDEMASIYAVERNELYENKNYLDDIHVLAKEYNKTHPESDE